MHSIGNIPGIDERQHRFKEPTPSKGFNVLVILAAFIFLPGLIFAQNTQLLNTQLQNIEQHNAAEEISSEHGADEEDADDDTAGEKAVEGALLVGLGAGVSALGVYIVQQSDPPDCDGTSYTTDPQTGMSPRDVCEEERDEEQENALTGVAFAVIGVVVLVGGLLKLGSAAVDAVSEETPSFAPRVSLASCSNCRLPRVQLAWSYRWK